MRAKKVVKFPPQKLPAATEAATKIQSWVRMLAVWIPARRQRNSVVEAMGNRLQFGLTQLEHPPEEFVENSVLRQLTAHQSAVTLSKNVKTAKYQEAALKLQANVRAHGHRKIFAISRVLHAAQVLNSKMRMIQLRTDFELRMAEMTIRKAQTRNGCQQEYQRQKHSMALLQAVCRRCVRDVISEQKRKVHQETFKRAYVNHKMWMMREIWTRRDAIIEIQSQIR